MQVLRVMQASTVSAAVEEKAFKLIHKLLLESTAGVKQQTADILVGMNAVSSLSSLLLPDKAVNTRQLTVCEIHLASVSSS